MNGKVYLVGAGPGDPELLTLKALRLLRAADVVLHDDLVTPEILKLVSPATEVQNVGKRCGSKTIRQEEINFLMVTRAASGLNVVRLKSGDPLIFGRAGEEIEALRRSNIEYEIVPGVTSVLGAAGFADETPCAIISRATTPEQQIHRTTVSDLHRSPRLASPALLVVGEVVRFADDSLVDAAIQPELEPELGAAFA